LNYEIPANDLLDRVLELSRPTYCRILTRPNGQSRGIGLVSVPTRHEAEITMTGFRRFDPNSRVDSADFDFLSEFLKPSIPSFPPRFSTKDSIVRKLSLMKRWQSSRSFKTQAETSRDLDMNYHTNGSCFSSGAR
jgi:hypothetical protein